MRSCARVLACSFALAHHWDPLFFLRFRPVEGLTPHLLDYTAAPAAIMPMPTPFVVLIGAKDKEPGGAS